MLELGELKAKVAQLETELGEQVLLLGKSLSIGNIEAVYSSGRTTYDWEASCRQSKAAQEETEDFEKLIEAYTNYKPVVDWKKMAGDYNWPEVIAKEPVPSVRFKLLEEEEDERS